MMPTFEGHMESTIAALTQERDELAQLLALVRDTAVRTDCLVVPHGRSPMVGTLEERRERRLMQMRIYQGALA
jgi:hypothetical protein